MANAQLRAISTFSKVKLLTTTKFIEYLINEFDWLSAERLEIYILYLYDEGLFWRFIHDHGLNLKVHM